MRIKIKVKKKAEHNPHFLQGYDPQRKTRRGDRVVWCLALSEAADLHRQDRLSDPADNQRLARRLLSVIKTSSAGRLASARHSLSAGTRFCHLP